MLTYRDSFLDSRPASGIIAVGRPTCEGDPMAALRGYLTTQEAAERMGVSRSYVCRLIAEGRLEAERFGGRVLMVRAASVTALKRRPRGRPRKKPRSSE